MNAVDTWYKIANIDEVDTPSLVIYPERVRKNIEILIKSIDQISRLRPHIKTHKSAEVIRFMLEAGIEKFKCATIAEAEVLGIEGAPDVLLAYQPVGPKGERFLKLANQFPGTVFACLVDNFDTAQELSSVFNNHGQRARVYVDLNVGMNRTGIIPQSAASLIERGIKLPGLDIIGVHAYDGHLRDSDLAVRKQQCDAGFQAVTDLTNLIKSKLGKSLVIVAGGTPTYSIHRGRKDVECSPGTLIYWDKGYADTLTEQEYLFAALVITRVVSKPAPDVICVDLGHKAIASENSLANRVTFLNAHNLTPIGHSEEHMVFKVNDDHEYAIGDVFYGVPFHICPTVALHQNPAIVFDGRVSSYWNTASRSRMISI